MSHKTLLTVLAKLIVQSEFKALTIDDITELDRMVDEFKRSGDPEIFVRKQIKKYLNIFNNLKDPIPVWRAIPFRNIDELNKEELGEFWSYKKKGAACYDRKDPNTPSNILYGLVKKQDVDWNLTLEANIANPDEYEITMKENTPIKVTAIEDPNGKLQDIQFEGISYNDAEFNKFLEKLEPLCKKPN